MSLTLGVALGAWSSARAGTWLDSLVSTLSMLFYATPLFWLALMGVLLFSVKLEWLPGFGFETVGAGHADWLARPTSPVTWCCRHAGALHGGVCPHDAHRHAGSGADGFHQDRPRQGLSPRRIQRRHILRNALLPVITLAGIQAGSMVGGTVLIETVFAWPGIGRLMFDALVQRDYNLLLGTFLITAALAVAFNIITDLLYAGRSEDRTAMNNGFWRRFRRNKGALAGLAVMAVVLLLALSAPLVAPHDPGPWCSAPSCRRWTWPACPSAPTPWAATSARGWPTAPASLC